MPGTVVFKPLSAKLTRNTEFFGKMDPYCRVVLGKQKLESQVCKNGGKHPHWEDTLVFKRNTEPICHVELKEKDWLLPDDLIGSCEVNLNEVENQRRVLKWYPMAFKGKPVGQVLLEISYEPDNAGQKPNKIVVPDGQIIEETIIQPSVVSQGQNMPIIPAPKLQEVHPHEMHVPPLQQNQGWQPVGAHQQYFHQEIPSTYQQVHQPQLQPQPQYYHPPQYNVQEGADKYPALGQEPIWAPSYPEVQQDTNYPQKYPKFDQGGYGHLNQQGGYYPNK